MSNQVTGTLVCKVCRHEVKPFHRFCFNCGSTLGVDDASANLYDNKSFQSALAFFCIYLFICLVVHFTNLFDVYSRLFWIEILIAAITLVYVQKNFKSIRPLLRFNNFRFTRLIGCIAIAVVAAIIINLVVFKFNLSFFWKLLRLL